MENAINTKINKRQSKRFLNKFENTSDNLINTYSCALQRFNKKTSILIHGTLFITNKSYAFYSNLFGYQTKIIGKWIDILDIKKDNIAILFPTAIKLINKNGNNLVFASFISRNQVFNKMVSLWKMRINEDILNINKNKNHSINKISFKLQFNDSYKKDHKNNNNNNKEKNESYEEKLFINNLKQNEINNYFHIIQCLFKKCIFSKIKEKPSAFSNNSSFLCLLFIILIFILLTNFFVIFIKVNSIENKLLLFLNKN
jgi:hypothetical protein